MNFGLDLNITNTENIKNRLASGYEYTIGTIKRRVLLVSQVDQNGKTQGEDGYTPQEVTVNSQKAGSAQVTPETDPTAVFANSDAVNTQKTITITQPDNVSQMHLISIYNPSLVTDLTVKVFTTVTSLGGGSRDVHIDTLIIPKAQAVSGTTIVAKGELVYGWMVNGNGKLVISNNTVLGGSDGFTATVRVNEL